MKIRLVLGLMVVVLSLVSIPVGLVWKQNCFLKWTRQGAELDRQIRLLESETALAELDVRELKSLERIEKIAKENLGLSYSPTPVVVHVQKGSENENSDGKIAVAWSQIRVWVTSAF